MIFFSTSAHFKHCENLRWNEREFVHAHGNPDYSSVVGTEEATASPPQIQNWFLLQRSW